MQLCLFLEQCFTWRKPLVQISVRPTKSEELVAQKILDTDQVSSTQNRHEKVTEKRKRTHASLPSPSLLLCKIHKSCLFSASLWFPFCSVISSDGAVVSGDQRSPIVSRQARPSDTVSENGLWRGSSKACSILWNTCPGQDWTQLADKWYTGSALSIDT